MAFNSPNIYQLKANRIPFWLEKKTNFKLRKWKMSTNIKINLFCLNRNWTELCKSWGDKIKKASFYFRRGAQNATKGE